MWMELNELCIRFVNLPLTMPATAPPPRPLDSAGADPKINSLFI